MDIRQDDTGASHPQCYFPSLTPIDHIWLKIGFWSKRTRRTLKTTLGWGGIVLLIVILSGSAAEPGVGSAVVIQADFDTITRFEARLNSADSASEVLRQWCADHGLAEPPIIRAVRPNVAVRPASPATRKRLGAGPFEPLRYRHVQLVCGVHVLSEADNWYRPTLLTVEMNRRLDQTDTPFGLVVAALNFHREPIAVQWLAKPSPRGTVVGAGTAPRYLLRHTAILRTAGGAPFSLVVETYTSEILAGDPSRAAPLSP